MSYPIVKLPDEIKRALTAVPDPVEVPCKPEKPSPPSEPHLLDTDMSVTFSPIDDGDWMWILFGSICLLMGGCSAVTADDLLAGVLLFNTLVASLIYAGRKIRDEIKLSSYVREQNAERKRKHDSKKREYQQALGEYRSNQKEYQRLFEKQRQAQKVQDSPKAIRSSRKKLLNDVLSRVSHPIKSEEDVNEGIGEKRFFQHLKRRFGEKIAISLVMQPDDKPESAFYPDFVYRDEVTGLLIDIEVDEPYVSYTGEPIHCKKSGSDEFRNYHFLKNNWIVIRFAEEQVFQHPSLCCDIVEDVASIAETGVLPDKESFALPKVSEWTRKEAHHMAFSRYRHSYIPDDLHYKLT